MVAQSDFFRHGQDAVPRVVLAHTSERLGAEFDVGPHEFSLFSRERAGLFKDAVWDGDLSNVMHRSRPPEVAQERIVDGLRESPLPRAFCVASASA